MVLRELDKALKTAALKMSCKHSTAEERAEWRRRYNALLKIVGYIKDGAWAGSEDREKAIYILSKGYKAAAEKYGLSRQALYRSFARANSDIGQHVPVLTIQLIMAGMVSAGISCMKGEQLTNESGFLLFPKGVLELLPEPVTCSGNEFGELKLATSNSRELRFLRSLTVNNICERMMKCDMSKLAKLLGVLSASDDGVQDRQLELAELLMTRNCKRRI